jgi:hypothetical protein
VSTHIIDELRPELPEIDPEWETQTVRAILSNRAGTGTMTPKPKGPRQLVRTALVAATVAAIVGGIFVARNHLPPSDVRPAGPTEIQKIDPSGATTLELGETLDVVADLPQTFNDETVRFTSFAGDGAVVGSARRMQDKDAIGAEGMAQPHAVMYDLEARTFTLLDAPNRAEPTQIGNVSGNERTVVWAEVVGTQIDHSAFALYAYDRRTKKVTALGEFSDPDGQIVYGNDLTIHGNMAYFSTPAYPAKKGQEAVYAVPVDGSKQPTVIAEGGQQVSITGDTLTYQVRDADAPDEYPSFFRYDLRTGKTTPVPASSRADEPGFCGAEFTKDFETWCVGRANDGENSQPALLTIKETSGRTTEFAPFPIDPENPPIPHDIMTLGPWTAITMTTGDGQDRKFLADLDTKAVEVFPENTSFDSLSSDRSTVLISSFADDGPRSRIVRIPTTNTF